MSEGIHFDQEKLLEDMDELRIRMALNSYMKEEGKALIEENKLLQEDPSFQPAEEARKNFHKRLNRYYYKKRAKSFLHASRRIIGKAAAVLFFLLAALSVPVFSIKAVRTGVFNLILDVRDEYTGITMESDKDTDHSAPLKQSQDDIYAPVRIPEGYRLTESIGKNIKIYQYANEEGGMITYEQGGQGSAIQIDTEDADSISTVIIQGTAGMLVEKGDVITATWSDSKYIFVITASNGNLSRETILDIAESVTLQK
mgnify:FL=1